MSGEKKKFNAWIPNFGAKGWGVTIVCLVFYFYYAFWNGGTNTLLPLFEEAHGWAQTDMSYIITIGGWISLIGIVIFGAIGKKWGAKIICEIGLVGTALSFLLLAFMSSFEMYCAAIIVYYFSMVAYGTVGVGFIGSSWFPRTKGSFMGIATIGTTASTVVINPLILLFQGTSFGISGLFVALAVVLIILTVITAVFIKNTPEEAGAYPDNDRSVTREELDAEFAAAEEYRKNSPWTTARVLKTPQTWLLGIGFGLAGLCSTGMISLLVPILMAMGHDIVFGVTLLSVMWPVGLLGHYLIGVIDVKFGSKITTLIVYACMALSGLGLFLFGTNAPICAVCTGLLLFALSGSMNMIMSLSTSIFGREDFPTAYPVIQVIYNLFNFAGISVLSTAMAVAGPQAAVLAVFIICILAMVPIIIMPYKQIASRTQSGAAMASEGAVEE